MKVLAFSAYYTPEIAASMYLTEDIYKAIVDAGHTIEVYVPMPTRGISDEVRREYQKKKTAQKYGGKLTIHRISMYREGKQSIFRALRYFFINVVFIWKGLKTDADMIFVQSTPPTQGMMAGILSKLKKIPLVYNLQDIFPDSLVNAGMTTKGSILWKIGRMVEDFSYRQSRKIIVISDDFKKNIMAKGVPEDKIVVIPNWPDITGVYPVERQNNVLIRRYNLDPRKFYICYSGNIGFSQNMDLLLDAAKELVDKQSDLSFVLIGDGVDKERVQNKIIKENISNVLILPFQPYEDIAHVFSLGDVGLVISKSGIGNNSIPSKTWNIMAAERPILASFDKNSELTKLVNETNSGYSVNADDIDEFIKGIFIFYKNFEICKSLGINGRKYVKEHLNSHNCTKKYIDTFLSTNDYKK